MLDLFVSVSLQKSPKNVSMLTLIIFYDTILFKQDLSLLHYVGLHSYVSNKVN